MAKVSESLPGGLLLGRRETGSATRCVLESGLRREGLSKRMFGRDL